MATAQAADQHQTGQQALAGLVPALVVQAWPLLDVHNLKATLPRFSEAVRAIVARYGAASAAAALQHYRQQRRAAGVTGPLPSLRMPTPPTSTEVADVMSGAVSGLYGPVDDQAIASALEVVQAEAEKLVLDQGRQAVQDAVQSDRRARGWARVPNAGACAFCLMLATRSAGGKPIFYRSAESAGRVDATTKWADAKGYINSFHPNCRCTVEPVFGVYEPTARTREADALWKSSTKGHSGKDALKAFRRAVEGRTDGPTRRQKRG